MGRWFVTVFLREQELADGGLVYECIGDLGRVHKTFVKRVQSDRLLALL